tara:strand:- start:58 stop:516 length:459 start_codon:yes stop_codon:yes gene_type:complete
MKNKVKKNQKPVAIPMPEKVKYPIALQAFILECSVSVSTGDYRQDQMMISSALNEINIPVNNLAFKDGRWHIMFVVNYNVVVESKREQEEFLQMTINDTMSRINASYPGWNFMISGSKFYWLNSRELKHIPKSETLRFRDLKRSFMSQNKSA